MRLAFMTFSRPDLGWPALLALAREHGYDGVEPRLDSNHGHGIEVAASAAERRAKRDAAERAGVAIACLATSRRFVDPARHRAEIDAGHAEIDLAGDVGCERLRVFGGTLPGGESRGESGGESGGMTREAAIENVAAGLRALADHAAERGVTLCLETHDDWCDPDHAAAIMRRCNHPAVAVNWDVMHTRRAGRPPEQACRALAPWVRHVHVHDGFIHGEKLEIRPIGTADIDHRPVLRVLRDAGYRGFLSGEWIHGMMTPDFVVDHLAREAATLRQLLGELP